MDRQTVWSGAIPRTVDFLQAQQNAMVALAEFGATVLGNSILVDGFTVVPTVPASLNVTLTSGTIYQLEDLEATTWSALAANTAVSILKQGIQFVNNGTPAGVGIPVTLGITPPGNVGYSQCFLVEVQYEDVDGGNLVLPYYNAANPAQSFSGPGDAGTANSTVRYGGVAYQIKAGIAATTGSQTAPTADAGWTGLFVVTVANGASTITSGNITGYTGAPFLAANGKLPEIPTGVQDNTWTFAQDTNSGGAPFATSASTATSSAVLTFSSVPSWVVAGMKAYDVSTPAAISGGQTVSSVTATTVTLSADVNATVNSGDTIAFSNNTLVANVLPAPTSLMAGIAVKVKSQSTITGASTFNLNGLGAVAIKRANGSSAQAGDITAGMIVNLVFDGSYWQIENFEGFSSTTTNNNSYTVNIPYAADSSGSVNSVVASFSAQPQALSAGQIVVVKAAHTNTGASTITVSGFASNNGTFNIYDRSLQALGASAFLAGELMTMVFDGTRFQINPIGILTAPTAFYVNGGTGSDTLYNGLSATVSGSNGPFATIQHALNIAAAINNNGFIITIYVANGAYTQNLTLPKITGSGSISLIGNAANPNNCWISVTENTAVNTAIGAGTYSFNGFGFATAGVSNASDPGAGIVSGGAGSFIFLYNVLFGYCPYRHMFAAGGGQIYIEPGTLEVSNGTTNHMEASGAGSLIAIDGPTLTIPSAISVTTWAVADALGLIGPGTPPNAPYLSITGAGNVSGSRFDASLNGVISTNHHGINYFPGNTAGTTETGGQYL